ncbi:hypothetical protein FACS189452_07980 [Bacteroidia bacterium]|nr:hypothetical protein FACS189452_07980 [Bacteroidia bacterium]GHT80520.1 hypothetical protein FACS189467_2880 [Bacteroidia bacterium]
MTMDSEKKDILLRNIADALFQLGVLAVTSFVFTGVLSSDENKIVIVSIGGFISLTLLAIAMIIRTLNKIK